MPYLTVNGLEMYYEIHGAGPPLLLLHGGSESIPEAWIPFFAARFRVIAPEQMGHGRTADLPERPFHYHDMAEDTVEMMRRLELERAAIVGYSDGGILGLDIAIRHPELVSALVTTGANARFDGYTLARLKEMWSVEPEIADEDLRRIHAPTLLIVGDRDIVTPEHTVEMFRSIPDAQLCIVPDAGHGAMPHEAALSFLLAGDR
jgi:pimeloyl-ACP methyl ester carboxylesterase